MRIVLVGGGVIALLTAVNCVSAGHEVVLVDQAEIPNPNATSFDRHRVIRALHLGDPATTAAAAAAHHLWIGLQRRLSCAFYEQVGALAVLSDEKLAVARETLAAAGSQHTRVMAPDELGLYYPQVSFPAGASAVLESQAGVLLADRVLTAAADWLRQHAHVELRPHCRAVSVDVDAASVTLADGEVLSGDALLLAAGPWSRNLLAPDLAEELVLYRQSMLYCEVPTLDERSWEVTPAMLSLGGDGGAWFVPPVADTPLKLSAASVCRVVAEVEDHTTAPYWREHLVEVFAKVIPGFQPDWLTDARDCYYLARASTGGPMLAVLGDRVLSYAACGGSSFKFAPLIARSLTERLTGTDPVPIGLDPLDGGIVRVLPEGNSIAVRLAGNR